MSTEVAKPKLAKSAKQQIAKSVILHELSLLQKQSADSQDTIVVFTPNNGERIVSIVVPKDTDGLEKVSSALTQRFKIMFELEAMDKAAIKLGELAAPMKRQFSAGNFRLDLFINGQDCNMSRTRFCEITRRNLVGLPYLLRSIQQVEKVPPALPEGATESVTNVHVFVKEAIEYAEAKMLLEAAKG